MNKQTITSICSLAALSAAMISSTYAGITETSKTLDVNFNDAADHLNDTTFKRLGAFAHSEGGGIAGDGALDFAGNYGAINWKQGLTGGIGTTITQSVVFTNNDLANTYAQNVPFMMGFTNNVDSHVANPTTGGGGIPTADAFQLQIYHSLTDGRISTTLRPHVDGANGEQKYANFAYTGTNMLRFDLTLTRTGTDTFDWGYVVTDLGEAGAGSTEVSSNTQSFTFADFGASLDGDGIYAALRSGNQASGLVSGLDQWSVNLDDGDTDGDGVGDGDDVHPGFNDALLATYLNDTWVNAANLDTWLTDNNYSTGGGGAITQEAYDAALAAKAAAEAAQATAEAAQATAEAAQATAETALANAPTGGLTEQDLIDLRVGSTLIAVSDGSATVSLQMEESSDLSTWSDMGADGQAILTVPMSGDASFFRVKLAD